MGRHLEIPSASMERVNLLEAWLKLEVPNREVIPHILEVESPVGLALISISSLSCVEVPLSAISGHHVTSRKIAAIFGTAIHDATEEEDRSRLRDVQGDAYQDSRSQSNLPVKGRPSPVALSIQLCRPLDSRKHRLTSRGTLFHLRLLVF